LIVQAIRNRNLNSLWLQALRVILGRANLDHDYAHIAGGILAGLVPASEAISVKMITGTVEQAAITLGLRGVTNLLRGPQRWAELTLETLQTSYSIAYGTVRYPVDSLRWGLGLANGIVELTTQLSRNWVRAKQPLESKKNVSSGAATIKLTFK